MRAGPTRPVTTEPNPVMIEHPAPHRPQSAFPLISFLSTAPANGSSLQHSGEEHITDAGIAEQTFDAHRTNDRMSTDTPGPLKSGSRKASRSRSRGRKPKKSAELVVESEDEAPEMTEILTKDKGKRKAADDDEDYMEVDELEETPPPVQPAARRRGVKIEPASHGMVKRSSSRPPDEEPKTIPASEPCESCVRKNKRCMFEEGGAFACTYCRKGKSRCSGVPETWRSLRPLQQEESKKTGSHTQSSSRDPATSNKKARQRSMSRGPVGKVGEPIVEKTGHNAQPSSSTQGGTKSKTSITVPALGQVPSNYMYLVSQQGKDLSTGIRLEKGDIAGEGLSQLQGRIDKLEEENGYLKGKVGELTSQLQHLSTTVAVLMAGHNGHTTMLESHRLALNDILAGRPAPPDTSNDSSMMEPIPVPPPSTPISKAQPLTYPSTSIRTSITPPFQPVKDPNVFWNSGQSPHSTIVENYMDETGYPPHGGITTSPAVSNRTHSPRIPISMFDSFVGPSTLFND